MEKIARKPRKPACRPLRKKVKVGPAPGPEESGVPGLTKAELEELREALYEYEMTHGDWSKL